MEVKRIKSNNIMNKLDENKIYSLEELTSEERKILVDNEISISNNGFGNYVDLNNDSYKYLVFHSDGDFWSLRKEVNKNSSIVNAKELFYTLENIQIDCTNETEERIKEMAGVFKCNGYQIWDNKNALIKGGHSFLEIGMGNEVYLNYKKDNKTTITYEKFMELFGSKEDLLKRTYQFFGNSLFRSNDGCYIMGFDPYKKEEVFYYHNSEKHGPNFYTKEDVPYHDGEDWKEDLVVYTQLGSGKKFVTTKERFKKFKEVWV